MPTSWTTRDAARSSATATSPSGPSRPASGDIEVKQPRVHDRRAPEQRERFTPAVLPPYLRRTRSLEELIPWLYLKGISTGDFSEALQAILGPDATGALGHHHHPAQGRLGGRVIEAWSKRSLAGKHYVYVWADGVHFNIRLEGGRQCILVLMGATAEGKKELIAIADGYRESEQSWKELLLDCKARGLEVEPQPGDRRRGVGLLEGDPAGLGHDEGAAVLGSQDGERPGQAAQGEPAEGQGGCSTRSTRPRPRPGPEKAFDLFVKTYEAKYPKATECLSKDREVLLSVLRLPGGALGAHPDDQPDRDRCSRRCGCGTTRRRGAGPGRRA